ncbi:hypothetical protein HN358_04030 [Candidatus Uhrbacteria bacterium]|nr:hypothetical protein [Candidatus Uhrbacteria bacterium]MBT7716947.1 hypothetical protein [Candidatus Uhrbacteria bacterium]
MSAIEKLDVKLLDERQDLPEGRWEGSFWSRESKRPTHILHLKMADLPKTADADEIYTFVDKVVALSVSRGFRMMELYMDEIKWKEASLKWMLIRYDQSGNDRSAKCLSERWLIEECFHANNMDPP